MIVYSRFLYPGIVALLASTVSFPLGLGQYMAGALNTHDQVFMYVYLYRHVGCRYMLIDFSNSLKYQLAICITHNVRILDTVVNQPVNDFSFVFLVPKMTNDITSLKQM